jgi:large subunit ribosomal protein L32
LYFYFDTAIVLLVMSVRMRHTRAHTKNRRSHHAMKAVTLGVCDNCSEPRPSHKMCQNCGQYRGRVVVDIVAKKEKETKNSQAK